LVSGETVTLALDEARPAITSSVGGDLIDRLSDDHLDLAGFYLAPGTNTVSVSAGDVAAGSRITMAYYERFIGV
jgi:hypothetical protein